MLAASGEQEVAQTISLAWAEVTSASTIIFEYKTDLLATSWKELGRVESDEATGSATFALPADAKSCGFFRFRVEPKSQNGN